MTMIERRFRCATGAAALVLLAAWPGPVAFAQAPKPTWSEVKCERYRKAWTAVLEKRGRAGLGAAFIERHEAFLASGCATPPDVCPRSPEEFEVANLLVIMAMNAGMASTFPPFSCRR
jgi:hypothetical protein